MTKQKRFVDTTQLDTTYTDVEGSYITVNDSLLGNITDVEVLGNTIQDPNNLEDIKSVGKPLDDGTFELELKSCGKNLFNSFFKQILQECPNFDIKFNDKGQLIINGTSRDHYMFKVKFRKGVYSTRGTDPNIFLHAFWYGDDSIFANTRSIIFEEDTEIQCYLKSGTYNNYVCNFQLELNETETEFEVSQESTSKIKLPVQLEKVGNVSDRLFRREDGVWCIEKNIKNINLTGNETYFSFVQEANTFRGGILNEITDIKYSPKLCVISDKLQGIGWNDSPWLTEQDSVSVLLSHSHLYIYLTEVTSKEEYINKIKKLMPYIKYVTNTPQIIELPFDTQIQLNSFFGTTHVFSEGSEVEPTIKGRIAKSIGASIDSVNTRVEGVAKEVEVIKNLEDTTLSTITTDTSSVSIQDTKEGYVSEVKLEGKSVVNYSKIKDPTPVTHNFGDKEGTDLSLENSKEGAVEVKGITGNTLVNLWNPRSLHIGGQTVVTNGKVNVVTTDNQWSNFWLLDYSMFKPSTEYTIIVNITKNTLASKDTIAICSNEETATDVFGSFTTIEGGRVGEFRVLRTTVSDFTKVKCGMRSFVSNASKLPGKEIELTITVLEGNYKNKPIPKYHTIGMQSTFENNLVTQEMIDNGEEKVENLGKYKANVKVVGKNLFNTKDLINLGSLLNDKVGVTDIRIDGQSIFLDGTIVNEVYDFRPITYTSNPKLYEYVNNRKPGTTLFLSNNLGLRNYWIVQKAGVNSYPSTTYTITGDEETIECFVRADIGTVLTGKELKIQVEESTHGQTEATPYEPYKEFIQTLYLDEPLYKDNELTVHQGNLGYWKTHERDIMDGSDEYSYGQSATNTNGSFRQSIKLTKLAKFTANGKQHNLISLLPSSPFDRLYAGDDGIGLWANVENTPTNILVINKGFSTVDKLKAWLQANPLPVIYELAEPIFVPLVENTPKWLLNSFNDCSLHLDTNIPPSRVTFKALTEELPLKVNTKYVVDFNCDLSGEPLTVNLGGTITEITSASSNRVELITPSVMLHSNLEIDGQGVKVSLVQVTEKYGTEGYIEGIKSVGDEVEEIEVISKNKNLYTKGDLIDWTYNNGTYESILECIEVQPKTTYTLSRKGSGLLHAIEYFTKKIDFINELQENGTLYNHNSVYANRDGKEYGIKTGLPDKITFTTGANVHYLWITGSCGAGETQPVTQTNIQLELGTEVTPCITARQNISNLLYQDSEGVWKKPVLRGVGDVKDTIEKHSDGKYYYHKRTEGLLFNGEEDWKLNSNEQVFVMFNLDRKGKFINEQSIHNIVSNRYTSNKYVLMYNGLLDQAISYGTNLSDRLCIRDSKYLGNVVEFKNSLKENNLGVVYELETEEVYPCTELKLNTYKGVTNYFVNSGVLSPTSTLKLSQNINGVVNILKDKTEVLEKKLGLLVDNVNTTVTIEKPLEVLQGTLNGYANKLLVEGRTFNNLGGYVNRTFGQYGTIMETKITLKPATLYTLKVDNLGDNEIGFYRNEFVFSEKRTDRYIKGKSSLTFTLLTLNEEIKSKGIIKSCMPNSNLFNVRITLIEGDLTDNPPSFFEGLCSTGEGIEEASLKVTNENLFNPSNFNIIRNTFIGASNITTDKYESTMWLEVPPGRTYYIKRKPGYRFRVGASSEKPSLDNPCRRLNADTGQGISEYKITLNANEKYLLFSGICDSSVAGVVEPISEHELLESYYVSTTDTKNFVRNCSNTKTIKYLDSEGQLKVPILRIINDRLKDTIELHSDGNYYYHKRLEKIVLNGSEDWKIYSGWNTDTSICFYTSVVGLVVLNKYTNGREVIATYNSKFADIQNTQMQNKIIEEGVCASFTTNDLNLRINHPKLATQDVTGFKTWLQSNPVEVIYQLETEEVYPCTNLDLVTYEGTTNLAVNFGAISPKITFTLQNNLYDSFKLMQSKVAKIESKFDEYVITQNLRQLRTSYRSDYANFGISVVQHNYTDPTSIELTPYAEDLFSLFKEVITNGEGSYDRIELEGYIDFYVMTFILNDDMAFELFDLIDAQFIEEDVIEGDFIELN